MSTYFIGDIHGCYNNLKTALKLAYFNLTTDTLYLTGDLISRGPNSLKVLRLIRMFGTKARMVLGNHDLYLLKTYLDMKKNNQQPPPDFKTILDAPDIDELINWLRHQSIVYINQEKKILMSHAGINPNWNIHQIKNYAKEIESLLSSKYYYLLFQQKYTNTPPHISHIYTNNKLQKIKENINIFTQMRYIHTNGTLYMQYKGTPEYAPANIYPWFNMPISVTPEYNIIFGHWASLQSKHIPSGIYGLDSGCCWGGTLTLLKWENKKIIQIPCSPPE